MRDLEKERVLLTAERLRTILDPGSEDDRAVVKKGLLLYRQGSVYNVNVSAERIRAKVQDVSPVSIILDLDFVQASECSCPARGFCRHLMAAFLYVYASVERVGTFVDAWKDDRDAQLLKQMQRASALLRQEPTFKEDSLESWHSYFEKEYQSLQVKTMQGLYHQYFFKLKQKAPKKLELKRLFVIHLAVVTIMRMVESYSRTKAKDPSLQNMAKVYVTHMSNAVEQELDEMSRYAAPFALDPLLEQSGAYFRRLLEARDALFPPAFELYKILWEELLNRPKWLEAEYKALVEKEKEGATDTRYLYAYLHILFLLKRDDELLQILEDAGGLFFTASLNWARTLAAAKNMRRLEKWIPYLEKHRKDFIDGDYSSSEKRIGTDHLLYIMRSYSDEKDSDRTFEEACRDMLPFSYKAFENQLGMDERFYEWAELNLLLGFPIYELDEDFLHEAEAREPESVLGLYKQTIFMEMENRNRESYRRAVRLMKKVKKLYKKLKNEEDWEDYLDVMQERYKRLRAFKEELVKGKLIDG
nr:SWIM zinc finger family protein [Metabacillus mangrovi]